jgi:hypothetical protein
MGWDVVFIHVNFSDFCLEKAETESPRLLGSNGDPCRRLDVQPAPKQLRACAFQLEDGSGITSMPSSISSTASRGLV